MSDSSLSESRFIAQLSLELSSAKTELRVTKELLRAAEAHIAQMEHEIAIVEDRDDALRLEGMVEAARIADNQVTATGAANFIRAEIATQTAYSIQRNAERRAASGIYKDEPESPK